MSRKAKRRRAAETTGEHVRRSHDKAASSRAWGYAATFVAILLLVVVLRDSQAERIAAEVIGRGIAAAVQLVLSPFDLGARAVGSTIVLRDGALRVTAECCGFDLMAVLGAAVIAYPAAWRRRLWGIAALVPFVLAINVCRVTTLAVLFGYDHAAFEFAHTFVWQGILILAGFTYWTLWAGSMPRLQPRA